MATVDPRHRILSCRLSAAEYAEAEAASSAKGYRSLSSFARSAVLAHMEQAKSVNGTNVAEHDLPLLVRQLAAELKRLSEHLRRTERPPASQAEVEEVESASTSLEAAL